MPSFEIDLISEINFAKESTLPSDGAPFLQSKKEGFDFIEITLNLKLKEYTDKFLEDIKNTLNGFEVLGHIHWEIDLSKGDEKEIEKVFQMIEIYKQIGTRKITIHPSSGDEKNILEIKENNLQALSKINNFCRENKIKLLIENSEKGCFTKAATIKNLVMQIPDLAVTLDVGHANLNSELDEFLKFSDLIQHIHLHDTLDKKDHLPFMNKDNLESVVNKLKSINYNNSITLEIFYSFKNNKYLPLNLIEKKELLVNQQELIRTCFSKNTK